MNETNNTNKKSLPRTKGSLIPLMKKEEVVVTEQKPNATEVKEKLSPEQKIFAKLHVHQNTLRQQRERMKASMKEALRGSK